MENLWLMLLALSSTVAAEGLYSTRIITEPSQGPFRIERPVLLSCQIEPTPPVSVAYQWRYVEGVFGSGSRSGQNITRTHYERNLHYCYYYCEVLMNGTLVDSASRIIELQGYLYTDNPVVRSFKRGENLELSVNISDDYDARYITAIAWYHNGTRVVSGKKYDLWNNTLRINNMVENDTGIYEARVDSLSYVSGRNFPECDSLLLPLLEGQAAHAPVTFMIQEQHLPVYDLSSIVSTRYVANDSDDYSIRRLELSVAVPLNSQLLQSLSYEWYKNGIQVNTGGSREGLSLTYNDSVTVIGDYIGIYSSRLSDIDGECENYYRRRRQRKQNFLLFFWKIKYSMPPSSVMLHFGESILTGFETTTVECTAVGGEPVEAINLTLWRNEELLAQVNGSHLSHMTTPYQYGAYRCSVESIHDTAILMERVSFQLLFIGTVLCGQSQLMETVISDLLGSFCQSCDNIHIDNIVDLELNCSAESAYITAKIVYSTFDGRLTASALVNRLHTWLLSQDTPSVLLGNTTVELNKQCPAQVKATGNSCFEQFSLAGTTAENMATKSHPHFAVGFFAGVAAGVVTTTLTIAIVICSIRLRASGCQISSKADGQSSEISMGINQAYYVSTSAPESAGKTQEAIYELPAV